MEKTELPYEAIVFVCAHARDKEERVSCAGEGFEGQDILEDLKKFVKDKGWEGRIRVSKSGCMDLCEEGPVVLVVPREGPPRCFTRASRSETASLLSLLTQ